MEIRFEYKLINSKFIAVDTTYQRELQLSRVAQMKARFNPITANEPKVSFRDGKYYVFDGQHTVAMRKALNHNADLPILCKVYEGMTQLEEKEAFIQQTGVSRALTVREKSRADFNYGSKEIVDIVRLSESVGIIVDFKAHKSPNRIVAVKALLDAYNKYGATNLTVALSIVKDSWNGDADSLSKQIIGGMALFCHKYAGKFDRAMLIRKLNKLLPIKLIREANISGEGGTKKYAKRILAEYNKNLSTSRLEDVL